jgi:glutamate formiminotransferase
MSSTRQSAAAGVDVLESEIVGLLPLDVLVATTRTRIKARELEASQIVEARLLQALSRTEPPASA